MLLLIRYSDDEKKFLYVFLLFAINWIMKYNFFVRCCAAAVITENNQKLFSLDFIKLRIIW